MSKKYINYWEVWYPPYVAIGRCLVWYPPYFVIERSLVWYPPYVAMGRSLVWYPSSILGSSSLILIFIFIFIFGLVTSVCIGLFLSYKINLNLYLYLWFGILRPYWVLPLGIQSDQPSIESRIHLCANLPSYRKVQEGCKTSLNVLQWNGI